MNQKSAQKITEHLTIAWNTNSLKQNRIADAILMFTVTEKKIYLDGECKPIGISKYNFTVSNVLFVYLIYTLYNKAKLLHYVLFFYGCNIPNTVCGCWCLYHYLNGQSNRWVVVRCEMVVVLVVFVENTYDAQLDQNTAQTIE